MQPQACLHPWPSVKAISHSLAPPTCDAEIAVLQLRHVWIPPLVVNPDASMALAHSSAVWHHEGAVTADPKQQGAGCLLPLWLGGSCASRAGS